MNESLKEKINNSFIEQKVIGKVSFTNDEVEELIIYSRRALQKSRTIYTGYSTTFENRLIFITLVEIAKRWNKDITDEDKFDQGFWEYIFLNFEMKNTNQDYSMFKNVIRSLGIVTASNTKWYYATVLMHALSPQKSLYSFFDLCYNIYRYDLDFNFTKEDEDVVTYCALRFLEIIEDGRVGDNDDLAIGSNVYSIKIGLRQLSINMNDEFAKLIYEVIFKINNLFHGVGSDIPSNSEFVSEKVNEWWSQRQTNINEDRRIYRNKGRAISQDNIIVKYVMNNNQAYLEIPAIRLKDAGTVWLYIKNEEQRIMSVELKTRRNGFTTTTVESRIKLNDLLIKAKEINLEVEITNEGKIIYNSKTKLQRQFILFGKESEITKQINPPSNYYFYTLSDELIQKISPIIKGQDITNLYNIYPQNGDIINYNGQHVMFRDINKSTKPTDFLLFGNIQNIELVFKEKSFQIFNKDVKLLIPKTIPFEGIEIKIGSERILLSDVEFDNIKDAEFEILDISPFVKEGELYSLAVYSHKNEKLLLSTNIVYLKDLSLLFNCSLYFGESKKCLEISYNGEIYNKEFGLENDEVLIDFNDGYFKIYIPWLKWGIDDSDLSNETDFSSKWYKENIHNSSVLEIETTDFQKDIKVFCFYGNVNSLYGRVEVDGENNKFKLGRTIYSLGEYERVLVICICDQKRFELCSFSTKEHFISPPFIYLEKQLLWCPQNNFIGPINCQFNALFTSGDKEHNIADLTTEDKIIDFKEVPEEIYQLTVKSLNLNSFLKEGKLLWLQEIIVGKKEQFRFKNREILIESVYCGYETNDRKMKFLQLNNKYFIDNLVYYEQNGQEYFLGSFGVIMPNETRKKLNTMRNSEKGYDKINPVRIEFKTNHIFEMDAGINPEDLDDLPEIGPLFYDPRSKEIHNESSRFASECINSYKYSVRRKKHV